MMAGTKAYKVTQETMKKATYGSMGLEFTDSIHYTCPLQILIIFNNINV